ncbi:thiol-disulfide oxidoreductase DCC family protein [Candidatus Poriferisocius sp.]|uniref:thiol-disulfide oxidoreductase DCC family protein n=1 Tax=Candidatus Poriferisocius sp. TaxID=3101276 RepID=UPI003B023455
MPDATAEPHPSSSPPTDATAEPHPLSRPLPAGTLIYDGDCGFCTSIARWVERRISDDYLVVPSQQVDLGTIGLTDEDVARSAWWIDPDGTRSDEHRSIAGALRAMSRPWPAVGRLLTLGPINPLAGWTYRMIAANRYRLPRFGNPRRCDR